MIGGMVLGVPAPAPKCGVGGFGLWLVVDGGGRYRVRLCVPSGMCSQTDNLTFVVHD